jgi:large subunit ribosomal protein L25
MLTVSAKPGDIPTAITYDISGMGVHDTVRVGDLVLPDGVTTDVDPDDPVVSATIAAMEVPEPEDEAVEGDVEGEDGDGEGEAGGTGADQS